MNSSTEIYIELYKRKQFNKIPVFEDETGVYYLSKAQLNALNYLIDETTFYVGYGGSGNSGKTLLECFYALFQCLCYDDVRYMIGRSELKNLKATTIQTLLKTFKFYGLVRDKDYFYNDKESYYYFKNGSRIICRDTKYYPSDPEMTDLGGLELTGAILDESVENKEIVINILTSRVGRWNNKKYNIPAKILEGFNPAKNHVSRRFWVPFRDNKETIEKKFVRALSSDNPNPEAREWERKILLTGDKITIQRLLHGNFDYDDEDNALIAFQNINNLFTNDFIQPSGTKFLSCDIALSNDSFIVIAWDGFIIEKIYVFGKIDGKILMEELKNIAKLHEVPNSNIVYDADGIGNYLRGFFPGGVGLNNNHRPTSPEYQNLKSELYFLLADHINNNKIFIKQNLSSELKQRVIDECQMIKRDSEAGEKLAIIPKSKVKELLGHSPDITDALAYRFIYWIMWKK